ncbi:hypothetical protein BmR1_04g07130 [Babesia microti strain RI]|uniref:Uncharacterized protein n=1 Tax=Babesia microti (strain RI) TaxID=1133968 RepID=A0A1N6LXX8_BABMR|nr:hypothetical protein BmR1_04g07130 [Babesia microti strain RI]SIO73725.1 hypothetical protein BmR1_04g07130 [Babesia microti strain RI]|eukprot:XP_021337791.1 hypothetical protein BmR1_04g07130 [Babesia microti strain RI]
MVQTRSQLKRQLQCGTANYADDSKNTTDLIDKKLNETKNNTNFEKKHLEHSSESGESFVSESRNSESALDYSPESESSSETELLPETESKFTEHLFKKPESPSSLEASSPDTPFGPYPLDLEPLESVFKKSARQPTYPSESGLNNFNKKFNGNIFHRDYESSESNNQTESSLLLSDSSDYRRQRARRFYREY